MITLGCFIVNLDIFFLLENSQENLYNTYMSKKITTVGGGTGQYTLLRGLKKYNVSLSAIVSMIDDGGSTGKLRDEFGVLPPGDLRRCLVALSQESKELRELFEYRLGEDCVGNMIIAGLQEIVGKENYIQQASKILNTSGTVLPITTNETNIFGKTEKGKKLKGQTEVSYNISKNEKIEKLWLEPKASLFGEAKKAFKESDLVIICPGDLYGSIIPNFLVEGSPETIQNSKAKIVYVCNLVTKQGTYKFSASDFVKEIEKYLGRKIDYVVLNKKRPTQKIVDKYKGEDSFFVVPDVNNLKREFIEGDLLIEHKINGKIIARHNPTKTAELIISLLNKPEK